MKRGIFMRDYRFMSIKRHHNDKHNISTGARQYTHLNNRQVSKHYFKLCHRMLFFLVLMPHLQQKRGIMFSGLCIRPLVRSSVRSSVCSFVRLSRFRLKFLVKVVFDPLYIENESTSGASVYF